MLIVTGVIGLPEGALDDRARAALAEMTQATCAEEGCITYGFWVDPNDATQLRVYEEWADRAALEAHMNMPHMATFRAFLGSVGPITRDLVTIEAGEVLPL